MKKEETSVILQLEAPQKRGYVESLEGGLGLLRHNCHLMRKY